MVSQRAGWSETSFSAIDAPTLECDVASMIPNHRASTKPAERVSMSRCRCRGVCSLPLVVCTTCGKELTVMDSCDSCGVSHRHAPGVIAARHAACGASRVGILTGTHSFSPDQRSSARARLVQHCPETRQTERNHSPTSALRNYLSTCYFCNSSAKPESAGFLTRPSPSSVVRSACSVVCRL
jgi:hypothetical protein